KIDRSHTDQPMNAASAIATRQRDTPPWRIALFAACLILMLWAALWGLDLMSDNGRIPSELAAAAQQPGDMVCSDGAIVRGDGSFLASVVSAGGTFRCIAWRMRHRQVDPATGATDWPSSPRR
ncbi:MAG: hypothetical protein M3Y55_10235, partial [Pseudomonadota bacterium]|nr:hypothetical protein [Pseudomonadota bacterium]